MSTKFHFNMPIKIHELVVRLSLNDKNAIDKKTNNGLHPKVDANSGDSSSAFSSLFSKRIKQSLVEFQYLEVINNER